MSPYGWVTITGTSFGPVTPADCTGRAVQVCSLCSQARNKTSLACMSYCTPPCVMLCDLTTCYSIESAWCLQSALETRIRETGFKLCFQFQLAPLHTGSPEYGGAADCTIERVYFSGGSQDLTKVKAQVTVAGTEMRFFAPSLNASAAEATYNLTITILGKDTGVTGRGLHSSTFHLNLSRFLSLKFHETTRRAMNPTQSAYIELERGRV